MSTSDRERRVIAFDERASSDPSALHHTPGIGRYVTVNPMSDEGELLAEIGVSPEDCIKVDCYWLHGDDVHFVQIHTTKYALDKTPGVYGREQNDKAYKANIVVIVSDATISQRVVDDALAYAQTVLQNNPVLGQALRRLG